MSNYPVLGRRQGPIPWGYDRDVSDPEVYIPDNHALDLLYNDAYKYYKTSSLRSIADWLFKMTGRKISHTCLADKFREHEKKFHPVKEKMLEIPFTYKPEVYIDGLDDKR